MFLRYELFSSDLFSSLNFGQVTDRQTDGRTESDAYEPTVHKHRCAQKLEGKERKAVYFMENTTRNWFLPKGQKNFLGSRVFDMGRSSYMKHKYFFPRPKYHIKEMIALSPSYAILR